MDNKTIYVVMPAHNVEKLIETTLNSLLNQTYPDWICLCMDDGSQDDTYKVMQSYAQRDKRILIFRQENKGQTKTMNILLNKVKGPYLAYLDADDAIHPQMFEILLQSLIQKNADVAEGNMIRFTDTLPQQNQEKLDYPKLSKTVLSDMSIFLNHKTAKGAWITKWNKIYRWDKVSHIRFSEKLTYEDDYFYASLVNQAIRRKVLVNYPFYFYRKNPNSLCGNVNWVRYQKSGINRICLSYESFVKANKIPSAYQAAFSFDLANDAYRMILRKPLKKGKEEKQIFESAREALTHYVKDGIVETKYLKPIQRFHVWITIHGWRRLSRILAYLA